MFRPLDDLDFNKLLGKTDYYNEYMRFFSDELVAKGVQNTLHSEELVANGIHNTLNEYLFKGDERADDMLVRLFSGKLPFLTPT